MAIIMRMVVVFPEPFGSEQADDRTPGYYEVEVGDRRVVAEALGHPGEAYRRFCH